MILLTSTLGLEGAVALEVKDFGYRIVRSESGRIFVDAGYEDIPFFNVHSRSAERVLYVVGQFQAATFDELYEGIRNLDWSFLKDPKIWVSKVRSVSSKLFSERSIQSVSMKAIVDSVKKVDGSVEYPVHVYVRKNVATVAVDTSGKGLHVRGYRLKYSKAPLRETIAASLLILARYKGGDLHDPFCGSGTIPIEASLISEGIPPGIGRDFVSEKWEGLFELYEKLREFSPVESRALISCSDIDEEVLKVAKENAQRAGVDMEIFKSDFRKVKKGGSGKVVTNPPYGKRLSDGIWRDFRILFRNFESWEKHFISPFKDARKIVGEKPRKTTPFFNSGVKVFFHQYY